MELEKAQRIAAEVVEKVVLFTVHKDGKRIGVGLADDVDTAVAKAKVMAENFGGGATFRLWECTEVTVSKSDKKEAE